ncbi:MAG: hypothetical protein FWF96_00970, partial [Kiritimatiellaeota bacterium]|nr:hypothetical protein [Kiritimatiellota bacterium]
RGDAHPPVCETARGDARPPFVSLEEFGKLHFDLAVEDAPSAVALLARRPDCRVIVFARPWNECLAATHERIGSWTQIARLVAGFGG